MQIPSLKNSVSPKDWKLRCEFFDAQANELTLGKPYIAADRARTLTPTPPQ